MFRHSGRPRSFLSKNRTLLWRRVQDILKKFGSDAHLYTFGPGVPILGPELVTATSGIAATLSNGQLVDDLTNAYHGADVVTASTAAISTYTVTAKAGTKNWLWLFFAGYSAGSAWFNVEAGAVGNIENGVTASIKPVGNGFFECSITKKNATATTGAALYAQSVNGGVAQYVGTGQAALHISGVSVKEILGYSNTYSGFVAGNYFDSAGTTHASVDGSVGAVLDAAGGVGAELCPALATENWNTTNAVISGGVVTASGVGAYQTFLSANCGIQPNKSYRVTYTISDYVSGQCYVNLGGYNDASPMRSGNGTFTEVQAVTNQSSNSSVAFRHTLVGKVSIVSVREVTGIHATQSTPGFKPTLRKGIVNLLTWSNDLTNAAWGMFGGTSKTATTVTLGSTYTTGIYQNKSGLGVGSKVTAGFVLSGTPGHIVTITATDAGGIYESTAAQVTLTATPTLYVVSRTIQEAGCNVQLVDYGSATTVTLGGIGLFAGTLTAAQILAAGGIPLTTTAPASSQAGPNYLEFGGDDFLVAPSATFGASGWAVVALSANYLDYQTPLGGTATDNAVGSAGIAIKMRNDGAVWFRAGNGDGNPDHIVDIRAPGAYQAQVPVVLAMWWANGGLLTGRVNGVNAGSAPLIYSPAGGSLGMAIGRHSPISVSEAFTGKLYFEQYGSGDISDADIQQIERFAAQRAGIQL